MLLANRCVEEKKSTYQNSWGWVTWGKEVNQSINTHTHTHTQNVLLAFKSPLSVSVTTPMSTVSLYRYTHTYLGYLWGRIRKLPTFGDTHFLNGLERNWQDFQMWEDALITKITWYFRLKHIFSRLTLNPTFGDKSYLRDLWGLGLYTYSDRGILWGLIFSKPISWSYLCIIIIWKWFRWYLDLIILKWLIWIQYDSIFASIFYIFIRKSSV